MILRTRNSGGEAGKAGLWREYGLALRGRENYLLCYNVAAILLGLNLIALGLEWFSAMLLLTRMRGYFTHSAIAVVIFLVVFELWIKPSIEYYWKTARKLSERNESAQSFKVQFYRQMTECYWQLFMKVAVLWTLFIMIIALFGIVLAGGIIYLMTLAPEDNQVLRVAQTTWIHGLRAVALLIFYCQLMHGAIVNSLEEEEEE